MYFKAIFRNGAEMIVDGDIDDGHNVQRCIRAYKQGGDDVPHITSNLQNCPIYESTCGWTVDVSELVGFGAYSGPESIRRNQAKWDAEDGLTDAVAGDVNGAIHAVAVTLVGEAEIEEGMIVAYPDSDTLTEVFLSNL